MMDWRFQKLDIEDAKKVMENIDKILKLDAKGIEQIKKSKVIVENLECEFKKEREKSWRLWCTKCDVDLIKKGIALECPSCNYRIVIFKKGDE